MISVDDIIHLAPAVRGTLMVTFTAFAIGLVGGFVFFLLGELLWKPGRALVDLSGLILRGVPPLTWIFLAFFGLPSVGLVLPPFEAGVAALGAISCAYIAEFFRGAFTGIGRGQLEAASALGLTAPRTLAFVTMPQALRSVVPPTAGYLIGLLKYSSLVSVLGVSELTYEAGVLTKETLQGPRVYLAAGVLYLCLSYPLSVLARRLEHRLGRGHLGR